MANLPTYHYIEVGTVSDVVRLAAEGLIPEDTGFTYRDDDVELSTGETVQARTLYVAWFGYPKTDDAPARVWTLTTSVSFEGAEGEPML